MEVLDHAGDEAKRIASFVGKSRPSRPFFAEVGHRSGPRRQHLAWLEAEQVLAGRAG
jgi:hypothetical protein